MFCEFEGLDTGQIGELLEFDIASLIGRIGFHSDKRQPEKCFLSNCFDFSHGFTLQQVGKCCHKTKEKHK